MFSIQEYLPTACVESIEWEPSRARQLVSRVFNPKHKRLLRTVRGLSKGRPLYNQDKIVQKLYVDQLYDSKSTFASAFLESIGKIIRFQEMELRIGFSLIVKNSKDKLIFLYAAKAKSFFKVKLSSKEEFDTNVISYFSDLSNSKILQLSFNKTVDSETFQKSGFRKALYEMLSYNLWLQ